MEVLIDDAIQIHDPECVRVVYRLLRGRSICGWLTGINVAAAVALAKQLGPGHTIVTILCDSGTRYQSRLFNGMATRDSCQIRECALS